MTDTSLAERDSTVARVGETSLRIMAGTVSPSCVERLRQVVDENPLEYPWERVVAEVLAEPADPNDLVREGLIAQRDWVLAGGGKVGAARPGPVVAPRAAPVASGGIVQVGGPRRRKSMSTQGKTALAILIVRGGFFVIYTATIIVLLALFKARWPEFDIYILVDWLESVSPHMVRR